MPNRIHIEEEVSRCLLCENAPCSLVVVHGDPARAIRAIRFGNKALAVQWFADCTDADLERAEQACIHYDQPIRIRELAHALESVNAAVADEHSNRLLRVPLRESILPCFLINLHQLRDGCPRP